MFSPKTEKALMEVLDREEPGWEVVSIAVKGRGRILRSGTISRDDQAEPLTASSSVGASESLQPQN